MNRPVKLLSRPLRAALSGGRFPEIRSGEESPSLGEEIFKGPAVWEQKEAVGTRVSKKRVIVIAGPTATGKSSLSLSLAQAIGGEIISADSMQLYRGMDVGTAKVTPEERVLIAHHLIDLFDLTQSCNVADYCSLVQEALSSIHTRDTVPLIVGGSGFYIHSILYGPPQGPPANVAIREKLQRQIEEMGPEVLYERLQMLDPVYAATISEKDRHKIVRALEIMALSDRKVSDFQRKTDVTDERYDFRCWFLHYSRSTLYQRIEERCEEMISKGLVEEVKRLLPLGLVSNLSASQAIGYRQVIQFLSSAQSQEDLSHCIAEIKKASRHYAKRQFTWFRKEPLFRWLNLEEVGLERAKEMILHDFEQGK